VIGIVDYGLGNVLAIANIFKRLGIASVPARTASDLRSSDKLILPGVGSFDWAMKRLEESGLRRPLDELVLGEGKLVLGICVGMQMMARRSEEGVLAGLGWIDAEVKRFDPTQFGGKMCLPHMGWNDVDPRSTTGLFSNLGDSIRFYFLHSYYLVPRNECDVLATTDYNGSFVCSAGTKNIYGVQFHPEKSHLWGIQLLKNFAEL
jgi:glutamine amidotransferase